MKHRYRDKVTLAVVFALASDFIACSVLKRAMIFQAVKSTFCTTLRFLITTKVFIENIS